MNISEFQPTGDYILVEATNNIGEKRSDMGLLLPDTDKIDIIDAEILKLNIGYMTAYGNFIVNPYKLYEHQVIKIKQSLCTKIYEDDSHTYYVCHESDIIGKYNK